MKASTKFAGMLGVIAVLGVGVAGVLARQPGGDGAGKEPVEEPKPGAFSQPYLNPPELQFGCWGTSDKTEDRYAEQLTAGDPAEQLAAARALWRGRSRRHAADVLKLLVGPPGGGPEFRALQREVEADTRPEVVLKELTGGDYLWGTWLAFLRPHKDFVPVLLAGLKAKPDYRHETVLALGNSGDPRALDPLLALLKSKDYREAGEAAQALGYLADPRAEPALIDALGYENWAQENACEALAKIGSKKALPALEKLAESTKYKGAVDVSGEAMRAVVAIERREHVSPRVEEAGGAAPKLLATLRGHGRYVWAVAFSPDGKLLASASDDRTVRLWDPAAGTALAAYAGHADQMTHVAFTDKTTVATAGWGEDGTVRLLDARTGKDLGSFAVPDKAVSSMVASPDGRWLAATGAEEKDPVRVWDIRSKKEVATLADGSLAPLAFSPDGRVLATTSTDGKPDIRLWDVPGGKPTGRLGSRGRGAGAAAFSPDGRTLAAGDGWWLRLWDLRTGKEKAAYRCDGRVSAVAFHPDGRRVVTAERDGPVRLWDVAAGKVLVTFSGHGTAALSPDGKVLATGSDERTAVLLWAVPDGTDSK